MKHSLALAVGFALAAAIGFAKIASADSGETAEAALARGNAAMKDGRVTEACTAFAASAKIDPKIDTRLKLAKCYEQDGKLVTAARLLRDTADDDADAARRQASIAKAAKLEAKAPKLRLALTSRPAGLVVKVDGVEVPSTEDVLVDLGPHEVVATAPGFAGRAAAPIDREGAILDVIVRMEAVEEAPAPAPEAAPMMASKSTPAPAMASTLTSPPAMPAMHSERHDHRKRNGVIMTAGGAALLVGAAVLFKTSADKFDEEQALCPQSKCFDDAALNRAHELISDSRTQRGFSIGMGIGGGLLVAAGAYLLLTPSKEHMPVAMQVDSHGASVAYTIGF